MNQAIETMTYDEHVKAIADAFDADFQAAQALHEAQEHKNNTRRALREATAALKAFTDSQVYDTVQTTPDEIQRMWLETSVDGLPQL